MKSIPDVDFIKIEFFIKDKEFREGSNAKFFVDPPVRDFRKENVGIRIKIRLVYLIDFSLRLFETIVIVPAECSTCSIDLFIQIDFPC